MSANKPVAKKNSPTGALPLPVFAVVVVCICGAAAWLWVSHQSGQHVAPPMPAPVAAVEVGTETPAPEVVAAPEAPPPQPALAESADAGAPQKKPKRVLLDPEAREALARVGLDSQAEQYWVKAIFDTKLPDKEREDLMEDLNEVGFPNPHKLTLSDLPLITSRLQIIEEVLPDADAFMQKHLGEARKDLRKMQAKIIGQ